MFKIISAALWQINHAATSDVIVNGERKAPTISNIILATNDDGTRMCPKLGSMSIAEYEAYTS